FVLVAPARQDDGLTAVAQAIEEVPDQGTLADTGRAVDGDHDRPAPPAGRVRLLQGAQVPLAPEQGRLIAERQAGRRLERLAPQAGEDLSCRGPLRRVAAEQVQAQ